MWFDKIAEGLSGKQIINDSKTPSGRVHVGSLRGVLIHDAVYRACQEKGYDVSYIYGIDDFDPLDGLPVDATPELKESMGKPLCNIPAPAGSHATDLADHYISEFLDVFSELGVSAKIYRMRDIYRSGEFNDAIDTILKNAHIVRKIYAEVSNALKPDTWYPFQVVCENCGKVGTTEVSDYDGDVVSYRCQKDLVSWAVGCDHAGKISPFNGNGKMPWKLEWVAKWHTLGITVEGAGKDHCTKGGSRDVAVRCLREIFGERPPLNIPYEFFLVSGAKMSSSKGVGTAAREMANFLPPEILRFLMIRTAPKKTVNFSTDFEYMVKMFNEHDRLVGAGLNGKASDQQKRFLQSIEVSPESTAYHPIGFQLLTALLQLPHLDVEEAIRKKSPIKLSDSDIAKLSTRISAAKYWLENYSSEDDRVELQQALPDSVASLSESQKAFLRLLADRFPSDDQSEEAYQQFIFDTARLTPVNQKLAFSAIYRVLLDKNQGPKGGALLSYLDKDFLIKRFTEIEYSQDGFWVESAINRDDCRTWLEKNRNNLSDSSATFVMNGVYQADSSQLTGGRGVLEWVVSLEDGKVHMLRVLLGDFDGAGEGLDNEASRLESLGNGYLETLQDEFEITVKWDSASRISKEFVTTQRT